MANPLYTYEISAEQLAQEMAKGSEAFTHFKWTNVFHTTRCHRCTDEDECMLTLSGRNWATCFYTCRNCVETYKCEQDDKRKKEIRNKLKAKWDASRASTS